MREENAEACDLRFCTSACGFAPLTTRLSAPTFLPGPRDRWTETHFVCGEVHEVRFDQRFLGPLLFPAHHRTQEESKVRRSLGHPSHQVGIPSRSEGHIRPHPVTVARELFL